jgi:hypothetical protein
VRLRHAVEPGRLDGVPLVVMDPVVLVNTAKVPDGPSARLLTLCAYGQTATSLATPGAKFRSDYAYWLARYEALSQSIPAEGRAEHWGLVLSHVLLDRVANRIGELRDAEEAQLDADHIVSSLFANAKHFVPDDSNELLVPSEWNELPDYTRAGCIDSSISIHTALRGGAVFVVTKLPAACDQDSPRMYSPLAPSPKYPVGATQARYATAFFDGLRQDFDFDAVDASVLERIAPGAAEA